MKSKQAWISGVVLIVGAAAVGVWTNGREGELPQPPADVAGPQVVVAPAAPEPAPEPAPPRQRAARGQGAELRRAGALQAEAALAAWHGTFVERCWNPSAARVAAPERIDLRFNLAFDPSGALVGLGISDNRRAYRSDVSACLRGLSVKLKIPAPGAPLQVQVPLTLP